MYNLINFHFWWCQQRFFFLTIHAIFNYYIYLDSLFIYKKRYKSALRLCFFLSLIIHSFICFLYYFLLFVCCAAGAQSKQVFYNKCGNAAGDTCMHYYNRLYRNICTASLITRQAHIYKRWFAWCANSFSKKMIQF